MAIGVGGALRCGVGDGQGSRGALLYCNNKGGARSRHFSKSARSTSIAANWLENVGGGALCIAPTITCSPLRILSSADTAGICK
jgi:hypothetical protein